MSKMPDEIYIRDCNIVNGCLPVSFEPSAAFKNARYIRADAIDPAILKAIDETLAYFDEELTNFHEGSIEDWYICDHAKGLKVWMLRKLRDLAGGVDD
jgi:hypothetical protein